ncbi:large ribosomal subunit protein bL32m [Centruroides vittatus]|uniref:large ribosomal subunit protein bL32m n=1 Tax=Centruroides vittatus TaxID=120091 RepID=UPI00350ED7EB
MAAGSFSRLGRMCRKLVETFFRWRQFNMPGEPLSFALDIPGKNLTNNLSTIRSVDALKQILDDGFLWAVPRNRRSIERRLTRKMGRTQLFFRGKFPKQNLIICNTCGHYHEAHTICGNCWKRVKEETEAMQEVIQTELKLEPVEKEVAVFYADDDPRVKNNSENKKVVEIPRERPDWFSKNLLSKTNS